MYLLLLNWLYFTPFLTSDVYFRDNKWFERYNFYQGVEAWAGPNQNVIRWLVCLCVCVCLWVCVSVCGCLWTFFFGFPLKQKYSNRRNHINKQKKLKSIINNINQLNHKDAPFTVDSNRFLNDYSHYTQNVSTVVCRIADALWCLGERPFRSSEFVKLYRLWSFRVGDKWYRPGHTMHKQIRKHKSEGADCQCLKSWYHLGGSTYPIS